MKTLPFLMASLISILPARADHEPNAQMKAVLDELSGLGGKPIETLSAKEARRQPTPADAVKALLKKHGKGTDSEPVGSVKDGSYTGGKPDVWAQWSTVQKRHSPTERHN